MGLTISVCDQPHGWSIRREARARPVITKRWSGWGGCRLRVQCRESTDTTTATNSRWSFTCGKQSELSEAFARSRSFHPTGRALRSSPRTRHHSTTPFPSTIALRAIEPVSNDRDCSLSLGSSFTRLSKLFSRRHVQIPSTLLL